MKKYLNEVDTVFDSITGDTVNRWIAEDAGWGDEQAKGQYFGRTWINDAPDFVNEEDELAEVRGDSLKPDQAELLRKLKKDLSPTYPAGTMTPEITQADIDQVARALGHPSAKQAKPAQHQPAAPTEISRTPAELKLRRQKLEQVLSLNKKLSSLIDSAEKSRGGLTAGIKSDIENIAHAQLPANVATDRGLDTALSLYTNIIPKVEQLLAVKQALYRVRGRPRRINVAEARRHLAQYLDETVVAQYYNKNKNGNRNSSK